MNNYFKLFFRRISKDFKQKQLLPLKLLFFVHSSTILVLYPYITVHMRELGINVEETAIMSAVTPVISILMPPLAGMLADKIGNFRVMLALFSGVGGLSALLLLLVPVGRITITFPDRVVFGMSCSTGYPLQLSLFQENPCEPLNSGNLTELQLESCGFACEAVLSKSQSMKIQNTLSYDLQVHLLEKNQTRSYTYTVPEDALPKPAAPPQTHDHKLKNNEKYLTSIRKLAHHSYYFPTMSLYNFSCDLSETREPVNCAFGPRSLLDQFQSKTGRNFEAIVNTSGPSLDEILDQKHMYNLLFETGRNSTCLNGFAKSGEHISITVPIFAENSTEISKHLDLGSCASRCLVTAPRSSICKNPKMQVELDVDMTFWSYLVIRVFISIISGTAFTMFEGAVIAILREHKADYGLQRIYATIGGMISAPLSGVLVDFASRGKGYTDFRPIFYLYAALKIASGVLILFINLEFKKPAHSVIKEVINVLKKAEILLLFSACLVLGSAWGYIESFLFWLLEDIGGTTSLMGLTVTVAGLVGIPLLVLSGPIFKKLGHANVIFIGFTFYVIRLIGYSLIYNPWLCLIFEAMEAVTFGLSFTAAVTYAAKLSNMTTDTTVQGILGGLYFVVGKGLGSLAGGYLIKYFGIRATFRMFAFYTAICGVTYMAVYHFYVKKTASAIAGNAKNKSDAAPEKIPAGFVDVDLDAKNATSHQDVPTVYEEALTNPAYEDTEFETKLEEEKLESAPAANPC